MGAPDPAIPPKVDDETRPSLLLRLRDPGDEEAWAEFDRIYRDLLTAYLVRRGTTAADAEEIYANVLVDMNRRMERFDYRPARGRFRNYLRRTVENAIRTRFRGQPPPRQLDTAVEASLEDTDDAELGRVWEDEWRAFHYRRAMRTLRQEYDSRSLDAFQRLIDGQTVTEVAAALEMSEQAVYKVKQRFRDRMRELIQRQVEEEDGV